MQEAEQIAATASTLAQLLGRDACGAMSLASVEAIPADNPPSRLVYYSRDCNRDLAAETASALAKMPVFTPTENVRFFTADGRYGLMLAHKFAGGNAELIVCATPGLLNRTVIRSTARWLFNDLQLSRVTVRARGSNVAARHYARRVGFVPEGVQRRWFGDEDCYLWGMLRSDCRWL